MAETSINLTTRKHTGLSSQQRPCNVGQKKTASHATAKFNLTKYMMERKTLQASNDYFYSDTSSNITTCSDKHKASWNKHGELTFILSKHCLAFKPIFPLKQENTEY